MMRLLERDVAPLFNGALAAVTAVAAAFATYAMPNDLFSGLVAATGLPALVPAAEPPLGLTARLAAMAAVSTLAFLVIWFVLGAIDAADDELEEIGEEEEEDLEEIAETDWEPQRRLRRADAHPDAPPRQPLLAKRELGEPKESISESGPDWMNPQPLADELEVAIDVPAEPSPQAGIEEVPAEPDHDPRNPSSWYEPASAAPLPEPPDDARPAWLFDNEVEDAPAAQEPLPPDVEAVAPAARDDGPTSTQALMAKLPLPEDRGESISSLFQRLDAGLANIEWPLSEAPQPDTGPGSEAAASPEAEDPDSVSHQLRDALGDLQRLAARRS